MELLTDKLLEAETGISAETWRWKRGRGEGPAFIKIGRRVYYKRADVEAWFDSHRQASA